MRKVVIPFLVGAAGGALVGAGVWWMAQRRLEETFDQGAERLAQDFGMGAVELRQRLDRGRTELRQQLAAQVADQVPAAVDAAVEATFNRYGITKARVRQINQVLDLAQRRGLL